MLVKIFIALLIFVVALMTISVFSALILSGKISKELEEKNKQD